MDHVFGEAYGTCLTCGVSQREAIGTDTVSGVICALSPLEREAQERVRLSFTQGGDKGILAALGIRWDGW